MDKVSVLLCLSLPGIVNFSDAEAGALIEATEHSDHDTLRDVTNTSSITGGRNAMSGHNSSSVYIGNGEVRLNLSGSARTSSDDRLKASGGNGTGIGTSLGYTNATAVTCVGDVSPSSLTAKNRSVDEAQWINISVPLRPESAFGERWALVPSLQNDNVIACVHEHNARLNNADRLVTAGDDFISELGASFGGRFGGRCSDPSSCTAFINDVIVRTETLNGTYELLQLSLNDKTYEVRGYSSRTETDVPDILSTGEVLLSEVAGSNGWRFTLDANITARLTGSSGGSWTLNVVHDGGGNVTYAAMIHDEVGLPQCGIVPRCVHTHGGVAPSYNPYCANDAALPSQTATYQAQADGVHFTWREILSMTCIGVSAICGVIVTVWECKRMMSGRRIQMRHRASEIELVENDAASPEPAIFCEAYDKF
jgi:hypothetical protein